MNKRKSCRTRAVALTLLAAGMVTAAFFIRKIILTEQEYAEGDASYDALAKLIQEEPDESPASSDAEVSDADSENQSENTIDSDGGENAIPGIDLDAAQSVNDDIVAWLYCPDTVIDYPVCYGDNNSYYLTHLADGTYNRNGCLFIDCKDSGDFTDDNTIIYGHHMASGKMFASLIKYADQGYYDAHPVMYLTTEDATYKVELFSGYVTDTGSSAYTINCGTRHEFAEWLREISGKSDFRPNGITISTEDHIVTLSTCAYEFQNARYVVHGRLVRLED